MRIVKIYAVGKVKDRNIQAMIDEYLKRLKAFAKVEIIELKDRGIMKESEEMIKLIDSNSFVLDEKGVNYSSLQFSELLEKNESLKFFIGGADGTNDDVKKKAKIVSLSKMTFTHEIARLLLIEQVYRAYMIQSNRAYHK